MEVVGAVSSCLVLAEESLRTVALIHEESGTQNDFAPLKEQITIINHILQGFQKTHGFFPNGLGPSTSDEPSLFILAAAQLRIIKDELEKINAAYQKTPDNHSSISKKPKWIQQLRKLPELRERARNVQSNLETAMESEVMSMMSSQSDNLSRYHPDVEFVTQVQANSTSMGFPAAKIYELPDDPPGVESYLSDDFTEKLALTKSNDSDATLVEMGLPNADAVITDESLLALDEKALIKSSSSSSIASFEQAKNCHCRCHFSKTKHLTLARLKSRTWRFSTSAGVACSNSQCTCGKDRWVKVQFQPPQRLWARSFLFKATYGISGLSVALRPTRILNSTERVWGCIESRTISEADMELMSMYSPQDVDLNERGLIHYAIQYQDFNAIELFLKVWANILPKKGLPRTTGFKAAAFLAHNSLSNREQHLLRQVISLANEMPEHKSSAVHDAARYGYDVDEALQKDSWALEELDHQGCTPLHAACSHGNLKAVQQLVKAKANVNMPDYLGLTPLMYAASNENLDCIEFLLEAKCNVGPRSTDGSTALHLAAQVSCPEAVSLLLAAGASASARGWWGRTPLHQMADGKCKDADRVKRTVDLLAAAKDVDIDAQDDDKRTPLFRALSKYKIHLFRAISEAGAGLHVRDKWSYNIMHLAACWANLEHLQYLTTLDLYGIDAEQPDIYNRTPRDDFLWCIESSNWKLSNRRRPSEEEKKLFAELYQKLRDRKLDRHIEISERAIKLLKHGDGEGARAQLSRLTDEYRAWQQDHPVKWYKNIDKKIQKGKFDEALEILVEDVDDMSGDVGTLFWDIKD